MSYSRKITFFVVGVMLLMITSDAYFTHIGYPFYGLGTGFAVFLISSVILILWGRKEMKLNPPKPGKFIVYIAHPISGDVDGNIKKILAIVKELNHNSPEVVPFAPYIADCLACDDNEPVIRARCIENDHELFNRDFIDEVWLFGGNVSSGMIDELKLARKLGIPVIGKTEATKQYLANGGIN